MLCETTFLTFLQNVSFFVFCSWKTYRLWWKTERENICWLPGFYILFVMLKPLLQKALGYNNNHNVTSVAKKVLNSMQFLLTCDLYAWNKQKLPLFEQLTLNSCNGPVTKLKNLSDVHSILLSAVENDFQLVIRKETYEIASDL